MQQPIGYQPAAPPAYGPPVYQRPISRKNRVVAGLLAIFIGGLGIHKFYLDRIGQGFCYLLFCWTGIPSLVAFIEGIVYLTMLEETFQRRYNLLR